ncbi:MAG: hypothetical protein HYX32_12895 [Actinobacteria bacterium]|nr:hypothetical protein [Actinomycetota bacterium]
MGFLDNVKKGLDSAASSLNQAVSNTQPGSTPGSSPPPPAGTNLDGGNDFIDGTRPETWFDNTAGTTLDELVGMELPITLHFGPPQSFETDDAWVARWADTANGYTLDVASLKEEMLGTYGTQEAVCAGYAAKLASAEPATIGDQAIQGSNGPGHRELLVCLGDLVVKCDLYGPADLDLDAAAIGVYEAAAFALRLNE